MKIYNVSDRDQKQDRLIYTGMLAIVVAILIALLGKKNLSVSLWITLFSTAVAIPFLSFSISILTLESTFKKTIITWYRDFADSCGPIVAAVGLVAVFWHFTWIAGLVFGVCGVVFFAAKLHFDIMIIKINK